MFDVLIQNARIVDGSGSPSFRGDIAVKDGKILRIAPNIQGTAKEVIDASGLVASPGFIDTHSHSDKAFLEGSDSYNMLEMGVTTQVAGNCGTSPAPYTDEAFRALRATRTDEQYARLVELCRTPTTFMNYMQTPGISGTNTAFFIGHKQLRGASMGYGGEAPSPQQMDQMQGFLREAMESGYLGFSTGLVYTPCAYSTTEDLITLAKAMAPYGGIYASHIRGEGDFVDRSVAEAIRIGEEAGVAVHISHLKVMGKHNLGRSRQLLDMIDAANAKGIPVTSDQYAYVSGSAPLLSQIPPKYCTGGARATLARLKDPSCRQAILHSIFHETEEFESAIYSAGFDGSLVTKASRTPQYENKTLGEIAREEGKAPIDALCDLLIENDGISQGAFFNQNAQDLMAIMVHPRVFSGADSFDYKTYPDPETLGGCHPRGTGNAVRRLELIRDFRLRSLEDAIKNMTYDPAQALHLGDQGLLKEGLAANITVFDYERLHANATFEHPYRKNTGIAYVLVNGTIAVRQGLFTGERAGKLILRSV